MICQELNRIQCKAYLVACTKTRTALLIDPERDYIERYLAILAYHGLRLAYVLDTHTHADHHSGAALLQQLTDIELIMHTKAPTPLVDRHVEEGDVIEVGEISLTVLYTPGHTPDSISLYGAGRVFTGDVILIGGTGRTDFAGGDSGEQYDSITRKLFVLPDDTILLPGHDYRGNTESTIGHEKQHNSRIANRSRQEYVELMASIEFPLPSKIQEVLQPNQTAIDDDKINYPNLAQLNEVRQLDPGVVSTRLSSTTPPVCIDVREAKEFYGELGHIEGSRLIPLHELADRQNEIEDAKDKELIMICRSGVRSTTAAAILTALDFTNVSNLKGGMVEWNERGLPIALKD